VAAKKSDDGEITKTLSMATNDVASTVSASCHPHTLNTTLTHFVHAVRWPRTLLSVPSCSHHEIVIKGYKVKSPRTLFGRGSELSSVYGVN
jgi:hypothetical protein